jgi:hypothetical protein
MTLAPGHLAAEPLRSAKHGSVIADGVSEIRARAADDAGERGSGACSPHRLVTRMPISG